MRRIVIGTGNPAKKQAVQSALQPVNIRVVGTDELNVTLDIVEDGATVQENARKKSLAYAQAIGQPVLSIDNALYLDGLDDRDQPGIETRKVAGIDGRATDEQLLDHYARLIDRLGGEVNGRWEYAVCIATSDGMLFETTMESPRRFVSVPSGKMIAGYPLESIQIDPDTGQYISEMSQGEQDAFWQKMIGGKLSAFVVKSLARMDQLSST